MWGPGGENTLEIETAIAADLGVRIKMPLYNDGTNLVQRFIFTPYIGGRQMLRIKIASLIDLTLYLDLWGAQINYNAMVMNDIVGDGGTCYASTYDIDVLTAQLFTQMDFLNCQAGYASNDTANNTRCSISNNSIDHPWLNISLIDKPRSKTILNNGCTNL